MMGDYWTDNGIEKPQQIVVCAACTDGATVAAGARHWDSVMRSQVHAISREKTKPLSQWEQGFIDQFGDFLTREEAMQIVKDNGQPFDIDRNRGDSVLFSEGLY